MDTNTTPRPELAGEIVTFKTRRCGDVPLTRIRDALQQAGLNPDEARDLLPVNAFRRALRKLAKDRRIDQLEDNGTGLLRFQLTEKAMEATGLIDYRLEAVLYLDNENHVTCPQHPEMAVSAERMLNEVSGTRTPSDVKSLTKRMFSKATTRELFCINTENGGAYFVPEAHREFTAKVGAFLQAIGGRLERFPVPRGTEEGNRSIGQAISEGISQQVCELDAVVEDWDLDTREATHDRYAERYREAVFKAEAMQEFLGAQVEEIRQRVEQSKQAMTAKIMQLAAEREQQSTAPSIEEQASQLGDEHSAKREQSRLATEQVVDIAATS